MSETSNKPTTAPATSEVSPDDLMTDFRGSSMGKIVLVTVIVHLVVIGGFSVGYIRQWIVGPAADLTDEQRMSKALDEGTTELRKIADRYQINFTELKRQIDGGGAKPPKPAPATRPTEQPAEAPTPGTTDKPKSEIEKTLDKQEKGPAVPDLSADPKDDIFSPDKP